MNNTLLLIDGNALMHRAFYALPDFKTKSGVPTNMIYGFISMVHKVVTDFSPQYLIVCFDTPAPTFRNKIFAAYQAQRPKISDDFITQIPLVKTGLDRGGIYHLEQDGVEADDLIGTISKKISSDIDRVLILTGDKDILQLVDKKIFIISPQNGLSGVKLYDAEAVKKKLEVAPEQIPDLKGLMGDPSDNYPGARGIGPKTAARLIKQFGTIENIYKNIKDVDDKTRKLLEESRENVFLSKKLATILTDVNIDIDFEKTKFNGFKQEFKDFLLKYDIYSLARRIFQSRKEKSTKPTTKDDRQIGLFQ